MARTILLRNAPSPSEVLFDGVLTPDNFGITYVRWPYDPAVSGGALTSQNPSRWQTELEGSVGWIRTFDPNIYGRYSGGTFTQTGTTVEGTPRPYGRMTGGTWSMGMLRSDGTYNWDQFDRCIAEIKAKGLKVIMMLGGQGAYFDSVNNRYIEYPLPTGEFWSTNPAGFSQRFADFIDALLKRARGRIDALELANEPERLLRLNTVVGTGFGEQLAVMCRITKQLIRRNGAPTVVLSPPFQGGETGEIISFLNLSAQGIAIDGVDGTGTVARDWIDVLAHHGYGQFADRGGGGSTTTMDAAGIDTTAADAAYPNNGIFNFMLTAARNVRAAARVGGWNGPIWNDEYNMTGIVDAALWYPRKMTQAGLTRAFRQMLIASIAGGYSKHIVYAADHPTLGFYDENVGTVPAGEPGTWWFKAPNNTSRGARALATAIGGLLGRCVVGRSGANANPWYSTEAAPVLTASATTNGVFTPE